MADHRFHIPSAIDMMIGAEMFGKIITGSRLTFGEGLPAVMNSRFEFIILGSAPSASSPHPSHSEPIYLLTTTDVDLHRSLQLFWKIEEPPIKMTQLKPKEDYCENRFEKEYSRDASGRYIVRLPFIEPRPPLGNSFDAAKRRFCLLKTPQL